MRSAAFVIGSWTVASLKTAWVSILMSSAPSASSPAVLAAATSASNALPESSGEAERGTSVLSHGQAIQSEDG
jgi:hypothetical protein